MATFLGIKLYERPNTRNGSKKRSNVTSDSKQFAVYLKDHNETICKFILQANNKTRLPYASNYPKSWLIQDSSAGMYSNWSSMLSDYPDEFYKFSLTEKLLSGSTSTHEVSYITFAKIPKESRVYMQPKSQIILAFRLPKFSFHNIWDLGFGIIWDLG